MTRVGVGKIALMESQYATSQDFLSLSNLEVNKWFGVYSLYNQLQKEAHNVQGTSIKGITKNDLLVKKVNIPTNSEEQNKIGNLFKQLDVTIALHQRKLKLLKQLKHGYLQSMFPQKGESVPKVRFANFNGEWAQRKLKDIAEFNPKSTLPETFEYVDLESVVGNEMISKQTVSKKAAPSRAQRLAKKGDIFFQTVRPYQKNNYLFDLPYKNYVFSTGYAQIRTRTYSKYLIHKLQGDKFVSMVLNRCTGTSYPAINTKDLAEIDVELPTNRSEQIFIGDFLSHLDTTIALYQSKIEKLQSLKKAYLQKMFI